eukprot:g2834.t1
MASIVELKTDYEDLGYGRDENVLLNAFDGIKVIQDLFVSVIFNTHTEILERKSQILNHRNCSDEIIDRMLEVAKEYETAHRSGLATVDRTLLLADAGKDQFKHLPEIFKEATEANNTAARDELLNELHDGFQELKNQFDACNAMFNEYKRRLHVTLSRLDRVETTLEDGITEQVKYMAQLKREKAKGEELARMATEKEKQIHWVKYVVGIGAILILAPEFFPVVTLGIAKNMGVFENKMSPDEKANRDEVAIIDCEEAELTTMCQDFHDYRRMIQNVKQIVSEVDASANHISTCISLVTEDRNLVHKAVINVRDRPTHERFMKTLIRRCRQTAASFGDLKTACLLHKRKHGKSPFEHIKNMIQEAQ